MKSDAQIITERIEKLFKRAPKTIYKIECVNDRFDRTYNFFFEAHPKGKRPHSTPLHTVERYELAYLEQVIKQVRQKTQLTIYFAGFTGKHWPYAQTPIQKRPIANEYNLNED